MDMTDEDSQQHSAISLRCKTEAAASFLCSENNEYGESKHKGASAMCL